MSFWGYSEKLEIFTGTRWDWESEIVCLSKIAGEGPREFVSWEDLPCNCGLAESCVKTKEHKAWHMSRHIAWRRTQSSSDRPGRPAVHSALLPLTQNIFSASIATRSLGL